MSTNLDSSSPHPCISSDEVLNSIARELKTAGISNSTNQASTFRNQRFHLQNFLTIPERAPYLFPGSKNYQSIQVQERLILLAAEATDHKNVLIAGLEVLEYTLIPHTSDGQAVVPERFVYIAKIDTSGNWPIPGSESQMKKSPVRALVRGYLNAMRSHKIKVSILSAPSTTEQRTQLLSTCTPKTSLYVFARAQPQYLFARSIKNRGKHILDDRGLIRWWKNMVGSAYFKQGDNSNNSSTTRSIQASWHIPGCESERHAAAITQTGTDDADMWTYGHPYKVSKGLSRDIIPQFPDDPKSRMIQSDTSGQGAVDLNTFWELVAISEECGAGRMTGFFRVVEEGTLLVPCTEVVAEKEEEQVSTDSDVTVVEEETPLEPSTEVEVMEEEDVSESEPDYTDMINVLLGLDFASLETSIESTHRWQGYVNKWKNMTKTRDSLRIHEHQVDVQVAIKSETHVASSPATATTTPVNVLSAGMIKRKVTTSSPATVAPVNILGAGMIKRKVTISSPASPATLTTPATTAPAINILDAGLIKRKETTSPPVNFLGASFIKRKQQTSPPPSIIEEAKRPKLDDTNPRTMTFNRPPQGAGPPSISPRITDFDPFAFQSAGPLQTTVVPSQGTAQPAPTASSPPLGTVLPPFFSKSQPQAHQKYAQGRLKNAPTSSTVTMPKAPSTSTTPQVPFTSAMPTFDKFKHGYVPAQNCRPRTWAAINDTSGATRGTTSGVMQLNKVNNQGSTPFITSIHPYGVAQGRPNIQGPSANKHPHGAQAQQGKVNKKGPTFGTGMFPTPQPVPNANLMTTRSGVQLMNFPPPPMDGPNVPQFQRPGYVIHFPDTPMPTKDQWVDYMTRHETYDPILVRLREAMSDVMAYCHTSYAPFATPEHYLQLKAPYVQRGPAPMFLATTVLKDTQAKGGIRPSDDHVRKKRRRMMVRINENLTRLLEMKKKGVSPMERIDALEDMANKELRRSGLFRTVITKLG